MQPPHVQRRPQLNPFAFPTETDVRFRLLVLVVAGSVMGLGALVMQAAQVYFPNSTAGVSAAPITALIMSIGAPCLVFAVARRRARRSAHLSIQQEGWRPFPPPSRDPSEQASLEQMNIYLHDIIARIPDTAERAPTFVWDDTSPASHQPEGMAFGFGDQHYVCLQQGLHSAFIVDRRSGIFRAVLLHELAHVVNRDVNKTTFSIALSRTFVQIVFALVGVLDAYLVYNIIRRVLTERIDDGVVPRALLLILSINVLFIILLLVVDVIRSSILRVREYYADVRAMSWLGSGVPFATTLRDNTPAPLDPRMNVWAYWWARMQRYFHERFARLHPKYAQRIGVLNDVRQLFHVGGEIAFLAGLLIGLALNAGSNIVSGLGELLTLSDRLSDQVQLTDNPLFITLGIVASTVLQFGWAGGMVGIWLIFGLAPVVGTIGTQVQKAAFADLARPTEPPLIPLRHLLKLALLFGLGIVLGSVAAPIPNSFSLWGRALLLIPLLIGGWALVALLWMLPLRWCAGRVFLAHLGEQPPDTKRRAVTITSAIALAPLFLAMLVSHIALGTEAAFPGTLPITLGQLLFGGVVIWFLALLVSGGVWACGVAFMAAIGWLRLGRCGQCSTVITQHSGLAYHCCQCGASLAAWAILPDPIVFPAPPAPLAHPLPMEAPPL